ncbi:membrane protein [Aliivibrio wodanis]|uniref:Membrane protein n=1 Tax=Aliivibrio wodanis TaxID=80852 RepID=A0A090IAP6_9GAMM|nr:membrane protein [Aliivibrio wodanis]
MNADEQKKRLRDQLYKANTIYSWEYQGAGQKYTNLAYWILSIFSGGIPLLFLWSVTDLTIDSPVFFGLFILSTTLVFIGRYLFAPDKDYCYHLTPMGIHYTEQDMIPEVAYKIVRGFAWVGIVVCIIVAFMLGPLAFVGAGAFALMSFGMTNFQSTIQEHEVFFSDRPILFNPVNDTMFRVDSNTAPDYCCRRDFYVPSLEQKKQIITAIQNSQKNIEYVELAKLNDMFKHPIFIQD